MLGVVLGVKFVVLGVLGVVLTEALGVVGEVLMVDLVGATKVEGVFELTSKGMGFVEACFVGVGTCFVVEACFVGVRIAGVGIVGVGFADVGEGFLGTFA